MTPEQMTPISAAAIALLSSLLSFLLSGVFQMINEDRKRKWQKEDLILQRRLEVIKKRISEVQIFLDSYFDLQNKLVFLELEVIAEKESFEKIANSIEELIFKMSEIDKSFANVVSFGDEELLSIADQMIKMINEEYLNLTKLIKRKGLSEEIEIASERERVYSFRNKGVTLAIKIGKRMDEISGFS